MSGPRFSAQSPLDTGFESFRPRVAVWRHTWLPSCETFIRNHVDSLQRWEPVPVGIDRELSVLAAPTDAILFSTLERRQRRRFEIARISARVERFLHEGKFDLVHAHFGNDAVFIGPICHRLGLPLIVTVHGEDVTALTQRRGVEGMLYRHRLKQTLRQAAGVLAVSDYIAHRARALGASQVTVHILGVPLPALTAAEQPDWDVLYTGRLVAKKGVDDLLQALAILKTQGLTVRAAVAGTGPLEDELRHIARQHALDVAFLGLQPPNEVQRLMNSSKMVVVPSKQARNGDCEGLPTVVMEAAAAARPVVGYNHSGIQEAVVHGVTGLLTDEGDCEGLARNIARLLNEQLTRKRMGQQARVHAELCFDLSKQTLILESIYDAVAAEPLKRGAE